MLKRLMTSVRSVLGQDASPSKSWIYQNKPFTSAELQLTREKLNQLLKESPSLPHDIETLESIR